MSKGTRKLNELTLQELKQLYEKNRGFHEVVYAAAYNDNMYWLDFEYTEIFGHNNATVEYNDHYTSFYLTITDHERFVNSICSTDYLTADALTLYEKAKQLVDKWESTDEAQKEEQFDKYAALYADLEKTNDKLLEAIEDGLHEYENVSDENVEGELQRIMDGMSHMSEWELDKAGVVHEYIDKCYA